MSPEPNQEVPLKPGDVVQLKSGGPFMTIESVDDADAVCVWFEQSRQNRDKFALIMLTSAPGGPMRAIRI